ncbi:het-s domain containing protein [Ophiostoma piceae UAMH 11346]|uniref:Het-s domain containing protein n=1 Tax=Ophiostoma piceae (strain UAMH 11346) TaxID=1262450 RepID=S3C125_OPHP1|nr:het-s domain containing protein [Ophiostoma piceae UAMH 11346]
MDTYFTLPVLQQLPFQRRLSRLYNDTKRSTDFVKEPLQNAEDPEIKALHRKLRIQKDRLVSWGLEWSDPTQSEVLIDSSISRAGLSEVVGSIMSTIKDTLAEVEPLWLSSKQMVDSKSSVSSGGVSASALDKAVEAHGGSGKSIAAAAAAAAAADRNREQDRDRKLPIVTWDKARFADLIQDLTVSIDTLYDLSRTRATGGKDTKESKEKMAMASTPGAWPTSTSPPTPSKYYTPPPTQSLQSLQTNYPYTGGYNQQQQQLLQQARSHHGQSPSSKMQLTSDEAKLFESSRMLVPQQIDSTTLTIIESSTGPSEVPASRDVVFMNKQAYADLVARPVGQSYAPLLLEYAYFDPVYSSTGIMPAMDRFEKLSAGLGLLQGEVQRLLDSWSGNPRLLGYFEDMDHSRLGLVYQFPAGFHAIASSETASQSPATLRSCLYSLGDLLGSPGFEPKLEAKFRLASNLANAVFEMHAKGIAHGNLVDSSILFGRVTNPDANFSSADVSQVDMRKPMISTFDLFPNAPGPNNKSDIKRRSSRLHQHPLNPISFAPGAPPLVDADPRVFDLYSLAMLLLSIGMWTRLENLVPHHDSAMVSEAVLEQLSTQCGTLYMKAVQTCWNAMETVVSAGKVAGESHLARLQVRASSYLEACCVLDDVSKLEERLRNDLGGDESLSAASTPAPTSTPSSSATPARTATPSGGPPSLTHAHTAPHPPPKMSTPTPPPAPLSRSHQMRSRSLLSMPARERFPGDIEMGSLGSMDAKPKPPPLPPKTNTTPAKEKEALEGEAPKDEKKEKTRMRLYPQVALPADIIEKWHSYLMPQVNYALRSFYRSHPESVEISIESVGDSPRNTRPTVVVVCTSVSKVRGILKRKLGNVFEGTNGIGLKVCTGRVMRSRKQPGSSSRGDTKSGAIRSGAGFDGKNVQAANSQFQQKPENGASIGAWIGDRHLPPVSFGGLVLVDEKPFGMTVHHMLDDPDATEAAAERDSQNALRSSAAAANMPSLDEADDEDDEEQRQKLEQSLLDWYTELQADTSAVNSSGSEEDEDEDYACEFSDTSSVSESDITSEWSDSEGGYDDDDDDNDNDNKKTDEPGDVPGVEPGYGEGYIVTQPALDDVDGNFYPDEATQDEDHLDSCGLGDVYASSGVRRRVDERGLVHEIDWALFEFKEERQPKANVIPHLPLQQDEHEQQHDQQNKGILRPTTVAPASALPGLEVQCIARTSGLQTGRILPTITSVKIYGRTSPSHTYQISATSLKSSASKTTPIGIPGDSGAWIVEREHGRLCGHVLAWSARKRVAYLCPMDVLLLDIAETLEAGEVRLPGGEAVVKIMETERRKEDVTTEPYGSYGSFGSGSDLPPYPRRTTELGERQPLANQSTSSLTLHESWESDGIEVGLKDGSGEGGSGSNNNNSRKKWHTSKMLELVGSMGKVSLGSRGGNNVQAPC